MAHPTSTSAPCQRVDAERHVQARLATSLHQLRLGVVFQPILIGLVMAIALLCDPHGGCLMGA